MTREEAIALYRAHARRLYNISLRIVRDGFLAEEIVHDTLLKFVSAPPHSDGKERTSAWLSRTCLRASIDAWRKRHREQLFLEGYAREAVGEEMADSPALACPPCDIARVRTVIGELPASARLILTLVLVEGLDYAEISSLTGIREGTLRTRYSRARRLLAEELKKKRNDETE